MEHITSISGVPLSPDWMQVGRHTYFASAVKVAVWDRGERIIIGRYCSIGHGVLILSGGGRRLDLASTYPLDMDVALALPSATRRAGARPDAGLTSVSAAAIRELLGVLVGRRLTRIYRTTPHTVIGNDVWIGTQASILGGVTVGDGAVIAAGSVVFSDVPPYAVVAGNPAAILRFRFSRAVVERLLRVQWWEWSDEEMRERLAWFARPITDFVAHFDLRERGESWTADTRRIAPPALDESSTYSTTSSA